MNYNITDLVFTKNNVFTRQWNRDKSEWEYSKRVSLSIKTSDGFYWSYTDSDGYSYWMDSSCVLGNTGTDYFFITDNFNKVEKYQQQAIDLLNRLK